MFIEDLLSMCHTAKAKISFLKSNPLGYFIASILAGVFVGFGVILAYTIGGMLHDLSYVKIVMGASFGVSLSLVMMAGAELFTGNNMVMTVGILNKTIRLPEAISLWIICWIGNFIGSIIISLLFYWSGLASGNTAEFIASTAQTKMQLDIIPLFIRAILCNMLVCLATWCGYRCKTESGKLIMVFWCIIAFFTAGFEHCIANMTLLTTSLLTPMGASVSIGGLFYNLIIATIGNFIGGTLFMAIPYYLISKKKEA